ncbi:MAG: MotE family protein [Candidatus Krumholzibacteriia bacterium]
MKSIVIISIITFVLIFGAIVVLSGVIPQARTAAPAVAGPSPQEIADAERAFADLAVERDRVQRDKEDLLALRTHEAVETKMLADQQALLRGMLDSLRVTTAGLDGTRARAADKLAKMYEAMKPDKAAPILATLEMDIVLDILQRRKERPAARILAYMDAGLAAQISARLSEKGIG